MSRRWMNRLVLAALGACVPSAAHAVNVLQICSVNDISAGSWSGSGDVTGQDQISIYNKDSDNYYITADTGGGEYDANDGNGHHISFQVKWNDGSGSGDVDMPHDSAVPATLARRDSCGTLNATVKVKFLGGTLADAYAGTYSAVLNLTLTTR